MVRIHTDFYCFSPIVFRTGAVQFLGRSSRSSKCDGKVARDEIKFARTVAESIKEEMVAKRVKESNAK